MAVVLEWFSADGAVLDQWMRQTLPLLRAHDPHLWGPDLAPSVVRDHRRQFHYLVHCPTLSVATLESILFRTAIPHSVTVQLRESTPPPTAPAPPARSRRTRPPRAPKASRASEPPIVTYSLSELMATDPTVLSRLPAPTAP